MRAYQKTGNCRGHEGHVSDIHSVCPNLVSSSAPKALNQSERWWKRGVQRRLRCSDLLSYSPRQPEAEIAWVMCPSILSQTMTGASSRGNIISNPHQPSPPIYPRRPVYLPYFCRHVQIGTRNMTTSARPSQKTALTRIGPA